MTVDVRIPPRNRQLRVDVVAGIIKSAWFTSHPVKPAKFVVLVDVDQAVPDDVLGPLRQQLPQRVSTVEADILFAYAQQHLESWYFADSENLRKYLGRSLGSADTSSPDGIREPKRHLSNLLGARVYTARTSEEIAKRLDGRTIEQRSPSFKGFLKELRNGNGTP